MFELGTFIVSIISFLIVYWIIRRLAFHPLHNMFEKRRMYVETQLSDAEKEREQAIKMAADQKEMLETSRKQAKEMIDHARLRAEEQAKEIVDQAKNEAERLVEQGRSLIEKEREEALRAVMAEVTTLTVSISEKLLREHANESLHEQLVKEADAHLGELVC